MCGSLRGFTPKSHCARTHLHSLTTGAFHKVVDDADHYSPARETVLQAQSVRYGDGNLCLTRMPYFRGIWSYGVSGANSSLGNFNLIIVVSYSHAAIASI